MSRENLHNRIMKDQDKKRKNIHDSDIVVAPYEYEELLLKAGVGITSGPQGTTYHFDEVDGS